MGITTILPVAIYYFVCTLFVAHLGYLCLTRASLRRCNSSFKSPGVVQTVLALWVSVPVTLYLADRLWWLSHCKYWSALVGLWYTIMLRELSASGLTKVLRKGVASFSWLPSTVNFILGFILFIWSRKSCLWACCWMTQVSSKNLYQNLEGWEADLRASPSKCSIYRLATIGLTGDPIAIPSTCS